MIGDTVIYTLTEKDAAEINRRRTTGADIAYRIEMQKGTDHLRWPVGAQAHIGNEAKAGQQFPMMVIRESVHDTTVSGQVFLDGTDVLWVQEVPHGHPYNVGMWCTRREHYGY